MSRTAAPRRTAIPYRDALRWILSNDDTDWLDQGDTPAQFISVTACLVADIYSRTNEEVAADLLEMREKENPT